MKQNEFNLKKLIVIFSLFVAALLLPYSCKESSSNVTSAESIQKYISAYTQGMIHEMDPIEFRFISPHILDSVKIYKAIKTSPSFQYKIIQDSRKTNLKIVPLEKLKRGASYTVELSLDKLFGLASKTRLTSKIKVFDQFLSVEREGIILDPDNNSVIRINVSTAIPESRKSITALFDCNPGDINIEMIDDNEYVVDLKFDIREGKQSIKWTGDSIGSKEKGTIKIWDFDRDEFSVVNTNFNKTLNEYTIYFTKLIDGTQDIKGLIRLGNEDADFRIDNNTIKVFVKSKTRENIDLTVDKGLKAMDGSILDLTLNYEVELAVVKPEIEWMADGSYIPASGKFKIPFKAKALRSVVASVIAIKSENASRYAAWNNLNYMDQMEMVRYGNLVYKSTYYLDSLSSNKLDDWNEYGIDFTNAFKREKGTIYHIQLSFGPSNTILNCEDRSIYDFVKSSIDKNWFENRNRYYRYYDYYDYQKQDDPCNVSYYLSRTNISKNVHCTNVFPVIKSEASGMQVAVKELMNNVLAIGARVDLINLQGMDIVGKTVATNGIAKFDKLNRKVHAVRVSYKGEVSYFSLTEGNENALTEFDISSNVKDVDNKIFIYTERDVWRPSDTIHFNVMLNRTKFHFEEDLPIVVRLKNPKNVLYKKYILPIKNGQSIYTFKMPTYLEAPTGYWKAHVDIGPLKTKKTLRVEAIKPNVVDLEYNYENENSNWVYNNIIKGELDVQYLAGYALQKGKVTASANIYPVNTPFSKYRDYVFRPLDIVNPKTDVALWSKTTDRNGKSSFRFSEDFKQYAAVSKIVIDSKIDLPGGGLNTETETKLVSPFSSYVGIKKSKGRGWHGSYRYGETPELELIRLDNKGELLQENASIVVTVYKYEEDWWYDRYRLSRNHSSQVSKKLVEVYKKNVTLKNGIAKYIHNPDEYESGMFKLVVEDPSSGHSSEYQFHSISSNNYAVKSNPVFIELELEKDIYKGGETMELNLPKIPDASALISIERGDKILDMFWTKLNSESLIMTVEEDWFPNFYLHVIIVQNYSQQNNDRPLRMYSVKRIKVEASKKSIEAMVHTPEKIEPNKTFSFSVEEKSGQAMEYTVALVDKGLLNLTGYQTPDPLSHFSKLFALSIKTWDIFQQLLHFLNPNYTGVISIGGDGAVEKILDESADFNRFKPIAFQLGPFYLEPNGKMEHHIEIPNYIGKLQLMLVACGNSSYGSTEKSIRVVSPLMIQSQLPRSLNLSDIVEVPITIFKDEESIDQVQLSAKASNDLIEFSKNKLTSSFDNNDQNIEKIQLKTAMVAGTTTVKFDAIGNGHKSFEETKLFINYPNSYSDKIELIQIAPGEEGKTEINSFGFEKTRNVDVVVSGALVPNFTKHYKELIQYPYGCLEQTCSKAMAMLFIEDLMKLSPKEKLENTNNLDIAILKIQSYQQNDGRFNYWENGYYHHWSDLYAGHFLIEAGSKHLLFKEDVLKNWLDHKAKNANKWSMNGTSNRYEINREETLQAYRLFLLAKAGKPSKSAMNRFRKRSLSSKMAKLFLAGAYYYTGMNDIGKELLFESLRQGESDRYYNYSFGSPIRNKAIAIYIMSLFERSKDLDIYYADWVSEVNKEQWLSTQDQGFAFMASSAYFGDKQDISTTIEYQIVSKKFNKTNTAHSDEQERYHWSWDELNDEMLIKNLGTSKLFVHRTERAVSEELYPQKVEEGLGLDLQYKKLNGENPDLLNIKQGEEIEILVNISNKEILDQENLALTLKMPSGWELLNPRLYTTNADINAKYIYQDFKDDKVYTYFNLAKNKSIQYSFRAKANLKGDYYLPAVRCENMYRGNTYATSLASRVIIK